VKRKVSEIKKASFRKEVLQHRVSLNKKSLVKDITFPTKINGMRNDGTAEIIAKSKYSSSLKFCPVRQTFYQIRQIMPKILMSCNREGITPRPHSKPHYAVPQGLHISNTFLARQRLGK